MVSDVVVHNHSCFKRDGIDRVYSSSCILTFIYGGIISPPEYIIPLIPSKGGVSVTNSSFGVSGVRFKYSNHFATPPIRKKQDVLIWNIKR